MTLWPRNAAAAGILALISISPAAYAQGTDAGLEIELLQLTPKGAGEAAQASCDMLWRVLNGTDTKLSRVIYSVGIYTTEEVLYKNVLFSDLPAGRSKLVQFAMPHACDSYQEVLFSDVRECVDIDGQAVEGLCDIERMKLSSPRTSVTFIE